MRKGIMFSIVASMLMLTVAAFARDKNRHNVVLPQTLQVGTIKLAAGEYTMEWNQTGSMAQVNFLQHGKSLAQVPAKVVDLGHPAANDSVTLKTESENSVALEQVQFGGHQQAFSFADTPSGE
jgi:hypothetical protein